MKTGSTQGGIRFNATKEDHAIVRAIVKRAVSEGIVRAKFHMDIEMDLIATHLNGCPLRLDDLLRATPFNLGHDVLGINRHLDRETGQLRDCFLPRYAQPTVKS